MEKLLLKLAVAQTGFWDTRPNDLSISTMDYLVGWAGGDATNEEDFVAEVLSYADNFTDHVNGALEQAVECGPDENEEDEEEEFNADYYALKRLLETYNTKGFDRAAVEKLAREDWKERHEEEDEVA